MSNKEKKLAQKQAKQDQKRDKKTSEGTKGLVRTERDQ